MGLDYYAILNIPRDSTLQDIKLSYADFDLWKLIKFKLRMKNFRYRKYAIATHPNRHPYPMHPKNSPEGIPQVLRHLPALTKNKLWEYVNEAYDVLGTVYVLYHFFLNGNFL